MSDDTPWTPMPGQDDPENQSLIEIVPVAAGGRHPGPNVFYAFDVRKHWFSSWRSVFIWTRITRCWQRLASFKHHEAADEWMQELAHRVMEAEAERPSNRGSLH